MPKRKKNKANPQSNFLTAVAWMLAIIALILSALVGGYYFGYENAKEDFAKQENIEKQKKVAYLKKLEEETKKQEAKSVNEKLKDVLKKEEGQKEETIEAEPSKVEVSKPLVKGESVNYTSASHEIDDEKLDTEAPEKREIKRTSAKPKVAIIIDDVSTPAHVKAIKNLSMPITMSFLPPSQGRAQSAKLAANEDLYMVHLPMEAQTFSAEEPATLRINDSQEKISSRIAEIKSLFPKVHYINNHTGSKFTSDEAAMKRLVQALQAEGISFVDSRTTGTTKAPKVMKSFGLNYIARDVFLDHHMDKAFIHKQIKKVVEIAKKHGSAVAIGHPHANTLLTLQESKKLFEDVELVYINKID
ncbi:MAG: divergent polysaccharide deacetylase family protein [Sulfurimonas sp.]|nr:divergent polysaccharide deacetylase family protein [Sulfurimonas sp.]MDD5202162.1 divergent polysaccharide deacetylase family protein [Sulfurimonas sp.]